MIQYEKRFAGWNLLLRLYGAPWPRAFIMAIPSTIFCVMLAQFTTDSWKKDVFGNAQGYSSFAGLVTFFLTFRTGLSNGRYMECVTNIKNMTIKLSDCAIQVVSATERHEKTKADKDKRSIDKSGLNLRTRVLHALSLMHALALMRFRGDANLTNLRDSDFLQEDQEPATDASKNEYWMTKRRKKSIFFLARDTGHFEDYFNSNPLTVLGGVSTAERNLLHQSDDKVYIVSSWITRLLGDYIETDCDGKVHPLMARCFTVLCDGVAAYENALKLVTTPFPFPFAQSAAILVHVLALITPLITMKSGPVWLCGVINFLFIFSMYLVNDVAQEIEEPFKYDPNDLPLQHYQWSLNQHLLTAYVKGMLPEKEDLFEHLGGADTMLQMIKSHKPDAGALKAAESLVMTESDKSGKAGPMDTTPLTQKRSEPKDGPLARNYDSDE